MACDSQQLLADAKCYLCLFRGETYDAAELVLLCAIRDGETVDCDAQALLNQAACLLCHLRGDALKAAKIAVLCDIANA